MVHAGCALNAKAAKEPPGVITLAELRKAMCNHDDNDWK